jgi:hypothetical protein
MALQKQLEEKEKSRKVKKSNNKIKNLTQLEKDVEKLLMEEALVVLS